MSKHGGRAHSKYSASGAERYFNCPGSVALSEGLPDKDSVWSLEGTKAHEVLERIMLALMQNVNAKVGFLFLNDTQVKKEMIQHGHNAAKFILELGRKLKAKVLVETRIYLKFIHPEMFGTFDGGVVDHFGTLHVFDYKYGAGHAVSPKENLQMIFYALGLAYLYDWNFKRVRLWIIQPRIKGYDGPLFWEISIGDLRKYVDVFKRAVARVEKNPTHYVEGSWCHWCKAKGNCPLKQDARIDRAVNVFQSNPIKGVSDGQEESAFEVFDAQENSLQKSEADWRKEAKARKARSRKAKEESKDFF